MSEYDLEGIEVSDEVMTIIKDHLREAIARHCDVMSGPDPVNLEDFAIDIQVHQTQAKTMTKSTTACWLVDGTQLILRDKKNLKGVKHE